MQHLHVSDADVHELLIRICQVCQMPARTESILRTSYLLEPDNVWVQQGPVVDKLPLYILVNLQLTANHQECEAWLTICLVCPKCLLVEAKGKGSFKQLCSYSITAVNRIPWKIRAQQAIVMLVQSSPALRLKCIACQGQVVALQVQMSETSCAADLLASFDELDGNKLSCLFVAHQLCYPKVAATNIPYLRVRFVVSMALKVTTWEG